MLSGFRGHHLVAVGLIVALGAGIAACGDDPGVDDCAIGDPIEGPTCACEGIECVCPSSGDCGVLCAGACDLQCAGSGDCDFTCGDACDVACTGSGDCTSDVDTGSTVTCTGSGACEVFCNGDCNVSCPGSGGCTVHCLPGAACVLDRCDGDVTDCGAGVQVCGGDCPL